MSESYDEMIQSHIDRMNKLTAFIESENIDPDTAMELYNKELEVYTEGVINRFMKRMGKKISKTARVVAHETGNTIVDKDKPYAIVLHSLNGLLGFADYVKSLTAVINNYLYTHKRPDDLFDKDNDPFYHRMDVYVYPTGKDVEKLMDDFEGESPHLYSEFMFTTNSKILLKEIDAAENAFAKLQSVKKSLAPESTEVIREVERHLRNIRKKKDEVEKSLDRLKKIRRSNN